MRIVGVCLALASALTACTPRPAAPHGVVTLEAPPASETEWRSSISADDDRAIAALPARWRAAREAMASHARGKLTAEGPLLAADAGQDHAALPPGSYNCRVVRLGQGAGHGGFTVFAPQFCFVRGEAGGKLSFEKQTGSDLPTGWLYPDGDMRYVFLGAQKGGAYGSDRAGDLAGVVERIGLFRWRLVVPREGAGLWVYELTPVPTAQQPG